MISGSLTGWILGFATWAVSTFGAIPCHALRRSLLRLSGARLGEGVTVYRTPEVRSAHKVSIGDHTSVGSNVILDGRRGLIIGRNVNIGSEVAIWTLGHDVDDVNFAAVGGTVVISDRAWLSFRCVVLPGVTIGEGAVVAAGAVVTKDVDPFTIVAGIPAEVKGKRNSSLAYVLRGREPFM